MTPGRERALGWLAVTAQFAVIAWILVAAGSSSGGPRWLWTVGLVCFVLGVVVLIQAFAALGSALTPTPVPNGSALRTGGVYGLMRHPIYTGVLLVMLGVVLRSPGRWPAVAWLVLLVLLNAKAKWEERMLARRFPEYPQYMRETGRFLPHPPGR